MEILICMNIATITAIFELSISLETVAFHIITDSKIMWLHYSMI